MAADEPQRQSDNAQEAAAPQLGNVDRTELMSEKLQPPSDSRVGGGLSSLEDLSSFPKTDLLGGRDKAERGSMMAEAKDLASVHSFSKAMRYMTRSA